MIALRPILDAEFPAFLESTVGPYAAERAAADGQSLEEAVAEARRQHAALLSNCLHTTGHHFAWIEATGTAEPVGKLWWYEDTQHQAAYVYQISVAAEHRRRGIASAALTIVQDMCRERGLRRISLNVFAPNAAAIALYRKLGFVATSMHMAKSL